MFEFAAPVVLNLLLLNWYLLVVEMNKGNAHKTRFWYLFLVPGTRHFYSVSVVIVVTVVSIVYVVSVVSVVIVVSVVGVVCVVNIVHVVNVVTVVVVFSVRSVFPSKNTLLDRYVSRLGYFWSIYFFVAR